MAIETPLTPLQGFQYPSHETSQCPYPFYEALREQAPVHRLPNGDFLISRWEDIVHIVRHPEIFSSLVGPHNPHILGGALVGGRADGPWQLSFTDDPQHKSNRSLNYFLIDGARARYESMIVRCADALIDAFIGRGEADFRSEFATPLPRHVIMEILGLPRADEERLIGWMGGQGPRGARLASASEQALETANKRALAEYMRGLILERIEHPRADYLSELARRQVERDGAPNIPYLVTEAVGMYGAAVATTAHFLANTMLVLLRFPRELSRVRSDESTLRPLLDEVLRFESPVQWSGRVTAVDTVLRGVEIPAHSNVLLLWASGNRDGARFEDPGRLWFARPGVAKRHLAFGHGLHRCLGAALALLEAEVSFERILARLDDLQLSSGAEISYITAINQRAPQTLPIVFTAS